MKVVRKSGRKDTASSPRLLDTEQLVRRIAELAADKKAVDIVALDIRKTSTLTDYFVIMSGTSEMQVRAIATSVKETLKKENVRSIGADGTVAGHWIVIDYGDVIVHIFRDDTRAFYDLEGLWADSPKLEL
ncbi:MAG: ribosome silencing factor [Candidatus Hydrogenedentes bacterium]|nr:ribosome silencing factor [Candidatus Hydrogenedentota bacterium]